MTQKQITKIPSAATIAAFISTVLLLIYQIFLLLGIVALGAAGILYCDPRVFSTCGFQEQLVDLFWGILAAVFGLGIPLFWLATNGFLIYVVRERQDGANNLLTASLVMNVLTLGLFILFWLVVVIFSAGF